MADQMRVAVGQFNQLSDERLRFARQMGVSGVLLNTARLPGERRWEFKDLVRLRADVEEYGLRLEALENVPLHFYDRAMLGLPERDEQIESYQATIRNMGKAGIPVLGYHFMPNAVWRTSRMTPGRGGALVTAFDMELVKDAPLSHDRVYGEDEMWKNYEYFIKAILPVAEESGVKLALHPDDPPVESLGGVARLFRNFEGFRRAIEDIAPSANHGLDFCMGCWSEMGGAIEPMKYFAERGKIVYVHFRDVQGVIPKFQECFLGEGNTDVVEAMLTLRRAGFTGFMIDDHVPEMVDDTDWHHRGRALATGYMMGLLDAVNKLG
jgi:mannonate dehydratase